ncbi:uncharacterized protein N7511_003362 [Penicillium nucicola]|uniref:uncharacterized protein n=1 Tax=Penicillium nucicola TaxID=1850975 RepID=UPI002545B06C|nr:uncharacterized protein N7511_003362 [Penicillium nucicola]KAJ5771311.1 hypothetical protein N7511_003362 [Penicillium nucicola]
MSEMKLRERIRAPVRYGDSEESEISFPHSTLRVGLENDLELDNSGRQRSVKRRKPISKPFDPNLPPAAFPSLDRPRTPENRQIILNSPIGGPNSGSRLPPDPTPGPSSVAPVVAEVSQQSRRVTWGPTTLDYIPVNDLENHVVSNNDSNAVYVRNMAMMAQAALKDDMETSDEEEEHVMRDNEDCIDPTQVLLNKIPNPKWNELNNALQLELVDTAMKSMTWNNVCNKLELGPEDRQNLVNCMESRNKQIERENKRLEVMRNKQRIALINMDNSDAKLFAPPPQLVLQRMMRQATREALLDRTMYTDLMLCTSGDVLAARQYLHQHGLPRNWVGDWGDSMVELRESPEDSQDPDAFQWKEELTVTEPFNTNKPCVSPVVQERAGFIDGVGMGGNGLINPRALHRNSAEPDPTEDWRKYFSHIYPDPPDSAGMSTKSNKTVPGHRGLVKLKVGQQMAAQIEQYERTSSRNPYGPRLSSIAQSAAFETPTRVRHNPTGPQFSPQSGPRFGPHVMGPVAHKQRVRHTLLPTNPFSHRTPVFRSNSPFNGSFNGPLGGNGISRDPSNAEIQARFNHRLQSARLDMVENKERFQAQRYDFQPKPRHSGVSTGGNPYRPTQPRAVQAIANAQRLVSQTVPQTGQYDAFWYEYQRAERAGNVAGSIDKFVFSDPIIMPDESVNEQEEKQPEEEKKEQPSSSELSSSPLTDEIGDEMMMVPTDLCSPDL